MNKPIQRVTNSITGIGDGIMDGSIKFEFAYTDFCLLYTSPSPRDRTRSRMPSSA